MRALRASLALLLLLAPEAEAQTTFVAPVDGVVQRHFETPAHDYGPGHRGLDLAVPEGTPVRAAAAGRVGFAGGVPGGKAVSIAHDTDTVTTYSLLSEVSVTEGDLVAAGDIVGRSGLAHPGSVGLHFGVRIGGRYVDPATLLPATNPVDGLRLMPVTNRPLKVLGSSVDVRAATGRTPSACRSGPSLEQPPPAAPNDNIAVVIGGLGSSSGDDKLQALGAALGYRPEQTYVFSYRGVAGPRSHEPYAPSDTFGDLVDAAAQLEDLLVEIGRVYPGRSVDLLAHSQGGIVARALLELGPLAGLPHVEHFVSFASPHQGAPIAGTLRRWDDTSWGVLSDAVRAASDGLPPPDSMAVAQLAPSSALLDRLGATVPPPGTRYLALGISNDVIVPADRAQRGSGSHTVAPRGWHGHSAILGSGSALGTAYDHLRDASSACKGWWDRLGPFLGRSVGALQWVAGALGSVSGSVQPWRI